MTKNISSRIEETPRVWAPEATWTVSRDNQEIAKFLFPAFGSGTYNDVVG
ncbi:MAG: hypothetical protein KJ718_00565 [Nanoarchaeota archaeon]|nr:hypothetical protein [Nanoarchaeota archaeon]MBU1051034.1 hypothetical protein [Nanoarchaeota archaeon]MBU1988780.1 hypothetical protein [Nanoarchaeota archaeon]